MRSSFAARAKVKMRKWECRRALIASAFAVIVASSLPANAAWRVYVYTDLGIAKYFPAAPEMEKGTYGEGIRLPLSKVVPATIVSVPKMAASSTKLGLSISVAVGTKPSTSWVRLSPAWLRRARWFAGIPPAGPQYAVCLRARAHCQ